MLEFERRELESQNLILYLLSVLALYKLASLFGPFLSADLSTLLTMTMMDVEKSYAHKLLTDWMVTLLRVILGSKFILTSINDCLKENARRG